MTELHSNQSVTYDFRCECKYCQQCIKEAIIYDECEGCFEGIHPCLPRISWDFENHLERMHQLWPETRREEIIIQPSKFSSFIHRLTLLWDKK